MFRKIIVLFLLIGAGIIFLPAQSNAAVVSETTITENAAPGATLSLQRIQRRDRKRWRNRNSRYNRRDDRRYNRRDDRRYNRRDDRRNDRRRGRRN